MKVRRLLWSVSWLYLAACSDDEDEAARDGSIDAALVPLDGSPDAGDGGDAGGALCRKYGAAAIEKAVREDVLVELATDCAVGSHFLGLRADLLARFSDCLTIQVQELFGCPGIAYQGSKSPNGLRCADMESELPISEGDYGAMLLDIVQGLTSAGISAPDIASVVPGLSALEGVQVRNPSAGFTRSTCDDAGVSDASAADASSVDASVDPDAATLDGG
jgi:hypothetical protein